MTKMPIRSYTSSPYQMMEPLPSAERLYGSATSGGRHHPFDEQTSTANHDFRQNYTHTPPPGALQNNFDPWMLDGSSCASPLSTCSSLSHSEGIATPPPYSDQLPFTGYHLQEPQDQLCQERTGYPPYRNMAEAAWDPQFSGSNTWNSHSLVPSWSSNLHPDVALPPAEPFVPSMPLIAAPVFSAPDASQSAPSHFTVDSSPFPFRKQDSEEDSESDSDGSGDEYEESSGSDHSTKPRNRAQPQCYMLGKWDFGMTPCERQVPHSYLCPLSGQPDLKGKICLQRFQRPEHCRRHVKTVHGVERDYRCKVPTCAKAFSRGDNLRDHYWTHLQRGGRIGKNDKMSLEELKDTWQNKPHLPRRRSCS
ncbi:hypothetical protein NX059_010413 [Plenodomus lindquistii]|nr:hypothetical protein NX059_010413 [Plenodomus lindquistii]